MRHYLDRLAPPPPPSAPQQLSPSSTEKMNASLLISNNVHEDPVKRKLFGSFKGFSLKPLPMTKPNNMGASNATYVHPIAKAENINEQKTDCIRFNALYTWQTTTKSTTKTIKI